MPVPVPGRLRALRSRGFRRLFVGQAASALGDRMPQVALSFAVLDRGHGADEVGEVLGAATLAMVVFLLVGGVIADRFDRRRVMVACDVVRFLSQGVTAGLLLSGSWQVWQLVVLSFVWGAAAAVFYPAETGLLPSLVPPEDVHGANALRSVAESLSIVVGPALAGVLVATVGPGAAMAVDAASFLVSAATLAAIDDLPAAAAFPSASPLRQLREGWQAFRSRTWVWVVVVQFGVWNMVCYAPTIVLGAVVAKQRLGGAAGWGTVLAVFGVGSLVGALLALRGGVRRPLLVAECLMLAFAALPLVLALHVPLGVVCAGAAVGGVGFAVFDIVWNTALQRHVPPEVLSRVSSYDWIGSVALLPVGYALAGPVSDAIGVTATLGIDAAAVLVLGLGAIAVPAVRTLRS